MVPEAFPGGFLLHAVGPEDRWRDEALALLTGPRPDPTVVDWVRLGQLYLLRDPAASPADGAVAALLAVPVGGGATVEIRMLRPAPQWTDVNVELRILEQVGDALRGEGVRRMVAGVGNGELARMDLLIRAGFRMAYVERDGRAGRDVLWFETEL